MRGMRGRPDMGRLFMVFWRDTAGGHPSTSGDFQSRSSALAFARELKGQPYEIWVLDYNGDEDYEEIDPVTRHAFGRVKGSKEGARHPSLGRGRACPTAVRFPKPASEEPTSATLNPRGRGLTRPPTPFCDLIEAASQDVDARTKSGQGVPRLCLCSRWTT